MANKPFAPCVLKISLESFNLECPEPGWLLGEIEIAGVPFHVEAVEVTVEGNQLVAVNAGLENRIAGISSFDDGSRYQTVNYREKNYFVVIFPHQD